MEQKGKTIKLVFERHGYRANQYEPDRFTDLTAMALVETAVCNAFARVDRSALGSQSENYQYFRRKRIKGILEEVEIGPFTQVGELGRSRRVVVRPIFTGNT